MVRRLPVLQDESSEDAAANRRSPGQWVLSAGVLTLLLWVALATIALPAGARLVAHWYGVDPDTTIAGLDGTIRTRALLLAAVPPVLALLLAAVCSGAILGRFAGRAELRHALAAGILPGTFGCAVALLGGTLPPSALVFAVIVLAATGAAGTILGWRLGRRRRANLRS